MKHLVTFSALVLTLPVLGVAQAADNEQHGSDKQQMGMSHDSMSEDRLTRLGENHIKLADLEDTAVRNPQDEEIGTLSDIILDEQGRVAAVIVTTGEVMGIGGETKALSWDDLQVRRQYGEDGEYNVIVNMSQEELENLKEFEDERRNTGNP